MTKKNQEPDDTPAPKFKIVDRRRLEEESEPEPEPKAAQPAPPSEPPKKEPEAPAPTPEPTPEVAATFGLADGPDDTPEDHQHTSEDPLGFRNVALSFLQTLSTIAWVHMGLIPHPQTQLVAKKMEEARKTIALFELIYSQVKDEMPPEANAEIVGLIRDLKANYVSQL